MRPPYSTRPRAGASQKDFRHGFNVAGMEDVLIYQQGPPVARQYAALSFLCGQLPRAQLAGPWIDSLAGAFPMPPSSLRTASTGCSRFAALLVCGRTGTAAPFPLRSDGLSGSTPDLRMSALFHLREWHFAQCDG